MVFHAHFLQFLFETILTGWHRKPCWTPGPPFWTLLEEITLHGPIWMNYTRRNYTKRDVHAPYPLIIQSTSNFLTCHSHFVSLMLLPMKFFHHPCHPGLFTADTAVEPRRFAADLGDLEVHFWVPTKEEKTGGKTLYTPEV